VQAEIEIKARLSLQPADVAATSRPSDDDNRDSDQSVGVAARIQNETFGIQAGKQPQFRVCRPAVFLKQAQRRERPAVHRRGLPALM